MAVRLVWYSDSDFCREEREDSAVASSDWVFSRLCNSYDGDDVELEGTDSNVRLNVRKTVEIT